MQLYLIRHTTPAIAKGICYGQSDIPVLEHGFDVEFEAIRSKLPERFDKVYSSPLKRCMKLAEKLSSDVRTDLRLKEINFGQWELQQWSDIPAGLLSEWMEDYVTGSAPGGENYISLHERTSAFLNELLQGSDSSVAIVTHAGNIRSFLSLMLDLPLKNTFRINLAYGSVVDLCFYPNKELNQLNSIK